MVLAAPLVEVHFSDHAGLAPVLVFAPTFLLMRGAVLLFKPTLSKQERLSIRLGAATAAIALAVSPISIRLAFLNSEIRPWWRLLTIVGAIATIAYLYLAFRDERARRVT
jgi:hypothetical protein